MMPVSAHRDSRVPALVLAAVLAYANVWSGGFQFDDFSAILENPHLADAGTFIGHLDHIVRPVLYATLLSDRALYGVNAAGYHLLNLLFHLLSGILVYFILTRAVTSETRQVPFWTALLFLVHPIQTETVTYISGRASGLMALLYLLAFFCYIKASEVREASTRRGCLQLGAIVAFVMSMGAKETAMTFPFMLLLWDLLIRRLRGASLRASVVSGHVPFWAVSLVAAAWAWHHPRYTYLAQFSFQLRPVWDNLLSEAHAVVYALQLFFCPWNQNFDHDLPEFQSIGQWPLPFDLLVLAGLIAVAAGMMRRLPVVSFGIGWFFLQFLPIGVIPRADLLSERNLYLPSIGVFLVLVVAVTLSARWREMLKCSRMVGPVAGMACVLVVGLSLMTVQRNSLYRDQLSLWSDAVEKSPNKARPHNNLGHAYALHEEWDRAIDEFRIAAQLDRHYVLAQDNLRDAYLHRVGRR
ncbi:MAG TPA: tetratricopeptide repeat protein [Nitrospira sp.]|nr:tetratricopeptide repeat protein [Nitrospira sp.]